MATAETKTPPMKSDAFENGRSSSERVKRYDGAAKTTSDWDGLKKDPELWFRNGNCLVHLYEKGQSKRGPSFKVPLTDLLGATCYPLIHRFLVLDKPHPRSPEDLHAWNRANPRRLVKLYIPPPAKADKAQAFHYHLATRNFFAFVFRRSLVGDTLGSAFIGLLHSMQEFRAAKLENADDLMDYLDEEGYLDLADKPDYALALLQFAEFFHLKEMYVRAFAHCVGMSEYLFTSPEYQHTSLTSKKLIRKSRGDLDSRLFQATDMLKDLLDEELSEAYLGIPVGARIHLERFRSFLLSFYTTRLGYYPPRWFGPDLFATMRDDFQALYELLVDDAYTASEIMPSVAAGGICTLQLIQSFDNRNRYTPLDHPLPLLPRYAPQGLSRKMPWSRGDKNKIKPEQRFIAHASLIKASNWKENIFQNELVRAYKRFEEDSVVTPNKADKQETVSLMDGRKMRWIQIYSTYQVLRSVTNVPYEVQGEDDAPYHMAIDTESLPPWKAWKETQEMQRVTRSQTNLVALAESPSVFWGDAPGQIELKPDIDYFALTHQEPQERGRRGSSASQAAGAGESSTRTNSITRAMSRSMSRNSTIRRSLRIFKSNTPTPSSPTLHSRSSYQEIIVHGYGNGTNEVSFEREDVPERDQSVVVTRSFSIVSANSSVESGPESMDSTAETADTLDSSVLAPSPASPFSDEYLDLDFIIPKPLRPRRRDVVSMMIMPSMTRTASTSTSITSRTKARPASTIIESSNSYSEPYTALVDEQREKIFGPDPLPRAPTLVIPERRRWSKPAPPPIPVRIRGSEESRREWTAMQDFMDGGSVEMVDDDVKPAWEQYADLGGLTETKMF